MATLKVMKLIDPYTGMMECRVCGANHVANLAGGGHYVRGSWQCLNGCELPTKTRPTPAERVRTRREFADFLRSLAKGREDADRAAGRID